MGTRCDFYAGKGPGAEWLGSVAVDGDPSNFPRIIGAATESAFRTAVATELKGRDDGSTPDTGGWPWPWEDSRTTDYAVAFFDGKVWASLFGHDFFDPLDPPEDAYIGRKTKKFPSMQRAERVSLGARSGLLVVTVSGRRR